MQSHSHVPEKIVKYAWQSQVEIEQGGAHMHYIDFACTLCIYAPLLSEVLHYRIMFNFYLGLPHVEFE